MKGLLTTSAGRLSIAIASIAIATGIANIDPVQAGYFNLDFDTDHFNAPIDASNGDNVADKWQRLGILLDSDPNPSTEEPSEHPLKVFNSNCGPFGGACSGGDNNLAAGVGNVLIMNANPAPPPDVWDLGGTFSFIFPFFSVDLDKITLLDGGGTNPGDGYITAFRQDSTQFTLDLLPGQDNTLQTYDLSSLDSVVRLDVHLPGSGAIAALAFEDIPTVEGEAPPDDSGGGSDGSGGGGSGHTTSVPEPGSVFSLFAFGVIGMGSWWNRKRN